MSNEDIEKLIIPSASEIEDERESLLEQELEFRIFAERYRDFG